MRAGWTRGALRVGLLVALSGCTSIDPGADFVIPDETFDPNYFYCFVEPQFIDAYKCGPGDPSKGDPPNASGCHYSSAVSGMALQMHPTVPCTGGQPTDPMDVAPGSPAQSNLESVSLEMSRDYQTAPLYVRPQGHAHPRAIFMAGDPNVVQLLSTWASK